MSEITSANQPDAAHPPKLPPYLVLRGEVFYYKRKLPAEYVRNARGANKGMQQIWKSLKTSDFQAAVTLLEQENLRFEQKIASTIAGKPGVTKPKKAAREEGTTKYLLEAHIPHLLSRYEFGLLASDDEQRMALTRDDRPQHMAYLQDWIETYRDCCALGDFSPVEELAADLLTQEGLIAPPGSEIRRQFLWALMSKDIELAEKQLARAQGQMIKTPLKIPIAPRALPTLLDLFDAWSKGQKQLRTRDTYLGFVNEFEAVFRALPVVAIDHVEHGLGYREHLANRGLLRNTVRNRIGGLATLVRFGVSEGLIQIASNPFENINFDMIPETPQDQQRCSFADAELKAIFHSFIYEPKARLTWRCAAVAHWGPLLGIFAGLRTEEMCQLRVDDIVQVNRTWVIRITTRNDEQNVKNASSHRVVPVHPELVACGFLRFVARQKEAGEAWLFSALGNENKYARFSPAYTKWHSAFLKRLGLAGQGLCFHSYRYNFKQQLSQCGVSDEVRDALSGHWNDRSQAGRGYMQTRNGHYPLPLLLSAVNALQYDALDFTHLHVALQADGSDASAIGGNASANARTLPQAQGDESWFSD